jgi:pimeloyl-ACP methyl ester carboxylesterase
MSRQREVKDRSRRSAGDHARQQLLAGMPITERRLNLAGVPTAVLEGGDGPPVVLLHGQGHFAAEWVCVIPTLVASHHVVAPDLLGHGASEMSDGPPTTDRALAWLGELIERTCPSPPALVGAALGGAIAARFAVDHGDRLSRLVLLDSGGLGRFRPSPRFTVALIRFLARPTEAADNRLLRRVVAHPDGVRQRMGERWEPFKAYVLDRAHTPNVRAAAGALFRRVGMPAIPAADLARIAVPTTLIWGRHDPVMRLRIAQAASNRYGWPLHVIDDAGHGPQIEQPEAVLRALHSALDTS